jgi:hypothetical protein
MVTSRILLEIGKRACSQSACGRAKASRQTKKRRQLEVVFNPEMSCGSRFSPAKLEILGQPIRPLHSALTKCLKLKAVPHVYSQFECAIEQLLLINAVTGQMVASSFPDLGPTLPSGLRLSFGFRSSGIWKVEVCTSILRPRQELAYLCRPRQNCGRC